MKRWHILQALLDMLQGQQPEGFQTEPPDVLGKVEYASTQEIQRIVALKLKLFIQRDPVKDLCVAAHILSPFYI